MVRGQEPLQLIGCDVGQHQHLLDNWLLRQIGHDVLQDFACLVQLLESLLHLVGHPLVLLLRTERGRQPVPDGLDLPDEDPVMSVNDEKVEVTPVFVPGLEVEGPSEQGSCRRVTRLVQVVPEVEPGQDEHHLLVGLRQLVKTAEDPLLRPVIADVAVQEDVLRPLGGGRHGWLSHVDGLSSQGHLQVLARPVHEDGWDEVCPLPPLGVPLARPLTPEGHVALELREKLAMLLPGTLTLLLSGTLTLFLSGTLTLLLSGTLTLLLSGTLTLLRSSTLTLLLSGTLTLLLSGTLTLLLSGTLTLLLSGTLTLLSSLDNLGDILKVRK